MSSNNLVKSAWAPGLIGMAISNSMFGASLGQIIYYVWNFPHDPAPLKFLVLLVFTADIFHLIGGTQFFWSVLVMCHNSHATACTNPTWGLYLGVFMSYWITFIVQGFYCHRVWIITGNRTDATTAIFLVALSQFLLGIWISIENARSGTIKYVYTTPLVPIASCLSTLCDVMITSIIFKYLWKSELRGRIHVFRDLVIVFLNVGALTCLISVAVFVVYLAQGGHYWVGSPAIVLSRCYVNSLLGVLNARRTIREREMIRFDNSIVIPSLSMGL